MKNWKNIGLVAAIAVVLLIPIAGIKYQMTKVDTATGNKPEFVGGEKCKACHEGEFTLWQDSHHAKAMDHATDSSILGDFNNSTYTENGITHKFYKRDGKFFVFTEGETGEMEEFEITHTFGYTPLQQYLIPFEKGRYQCLHIAWDTENEKWFNMAAMVYGETPPPGDWLHWTRQGQNWNGMCAECHSTNLQKNYIVETDSFHTSFNEINVSCEACHGPGSKHIEWADLPVSRQKLVPNYGLVAKTSGIDNEEYVNLCARCHTRRMQIGDFDHEFGDLLDIMTPVLLLEDYHSDGQILNEDYVFGSFTQSKMYHAAIKCNDCHNVHSGERHFEGNQLCFQCHVPDYYGSEKHHFHKNTGEKSAPYYIDGEERVIGEGAECINCHMPAQYYMGIDFRNDHSIRIPRPDLSKEIGTPNACNQCHTDKSVDWSLKYFEEWYGKKNRPHFGSVFAEARKNNSEVIEQLITIVRDELSPVIVRASAVNYLSTYNDSLAQLVLREALDSPESMIRHEALRNYSNADVDTYVTDIGSLLNDPVKAVRMQAGLLFSYLPNEYVPEKYLEDYQNALAEFRMQSEYMGDFPGGRANLALMYSNLGDAESTIKHYEKSVEIDSGYTPALVNLAMAYNSVGKNRNAEQIYRSLIKTTPNLSGVYYSLGLLLVEQNKFEEALEVLEIAAIKDSENSRINYNLGLLYSQQQQLADAEKHLKLAVKKQSDNFDYEYALAHFYLSSKQYSKAEVALLKMLERYPNDQNVRQMYDYLMGLR